VRTFKVKGYKRGRKSPAFKDFLAGIYRERDNSESSIFPRSTLSETDDDGSWGRWSQATTPSDTHHTVEQVSEPVDVSQPPFSESPRQSGLIVEIPPLRASLAREYAREASLAMNDDIQELVDRQVAMEASQFGILVDSSRRSSPTNRHSDQDHTKLEATHIEDRFLQQLMETAKDQTPARSPNPVSLKDLSTTVPNRTIDSSHKITGVYNNCSTTKNPGSGFTSLRLPKPKSSNVVDLTGEKSASLTKPLRRQRTFRTSTTVLTFNREEQTTTVQEDKSMGEDEDDGIMIIGTSRRRHQTVLSIRSRSLSEAVVNDTSGNALTSIPQSRIPQSKKKAPVK
jgi:hypothetical protein